MAKSLSKYYGAGNKQAGGATGNRRLSEYYGSLGQDYTSAKQIADTFAANIDEYPRFFRRSLIIEKLRLRYDREIALLSDALYVLQQRGLIIFDTDSNMWKVNNGE